MKITVQLQGTTPLLHHNPRMVDPDFELARELKRLTSKRKKTDEDLRQIAKLEWYGGLYEEDGVVVQPTSKVRKCLINTARISKLGKMIERAVSFSDLNVPQGYEGAARPIDDIFADARFTSRLSVGVSRARVMRVRPQFFPWALQVDGLLIEDAGLNVDELERVVELAGLVEGIGDNRINGYGRFKGTLICHKNGSSLHEKTDGRTRKSSSTS